MCQFRADLIAALRIMRDRVVRVLRVRRYVFDELDFFQDVVTVWLAEIDRTNPIFKELENAESEASKHLDRVIDRVRKWYTREKHFLPLTDDVSEPDTSEAVEQRDEQEEELRRLKAAIEDLPEPERSIMQQRYLGVPHQQIADSLGLTLSQEYARYTKACCTLNALLRGDA
jgi:RNA polymerase sigma factor (sigma-70 family)